MNNYIHRFLDHAQLMRSKIHASCGGSHDVATSSIRKAKFHAEKVSHKPKQPIALKRREELNCEFNDYLLKNTPWYLAESLNPFLRIFSDNLRIFSDNNVPTVALFNAMNSQMLRDNIGITAKHKEILERELLKKHSNTIQTLFAENDEVLKVNADTFWFNWGKEIHEQIRKYKTFVTEKFPP